MELCNLIAYHLTIVLSASYIVLRVFWKHGGKELSIVQYNMSLLHYPNLCPKIMNCPGLATCKKLIMEILEMLIKSEREMTSVKSSSRNPLPAVLECLMKQN